MGKHEAIRPAMRPSDVIKAMRELNAAGNRAMLRPDGTLVSEPMSAADADVVTPALIDWSRPR